MKKILVLLFSLFCLYSALAQESIYNLYKAQEWEKLEKKVLPGLQKQPKDAVYNHVASLMFSNSAYSKYDYDKAYSYLLVTKNELSKMTPAEREKYSKYMTPKKVQVQLDSVCQKLYEITIKSNSIEKCNVFLQKYKKASATLQETVVTYRNTLAYNNALQKNTVEAYQDFISLYPEAHEAALAVKRRDKLAYEETMRKNSCEAFMNFLKNYPKSEYVPEIQQKYVDKIFSEKSGSGDYKEYEQFVKASPDNKLTVIALRKMLDIAKSEKNLPLMQKTVEYSRDIDFEYALTEFYKEFTQDGETYTLYTFVDMYPRTFLDSLIAKDFKIAGKGDALDFIEPYDSVKSFRLFSEYVKLAAPKEKAFVALQKMISNDIAAKNWRNAIKTVNNYKSYFGKNDKRINDLLRILSSSVDKSISVKELSEVINTKEGGEYSPIITADNQFLYFCGKNRPDNVGKTEDIFVSEWTNGDWGTPRLVSELSSPVSNEAVISISTDGTKMLYFKEGVILSSEKTYYGWEEGVNVSPEINNAKWSADAMITSDGNAIIFASVREEGYNLYTRQNASLGVYHGAIHHQSDIYVSLKTDNGWSKPINLGPTINTMYVERSPYLHHDMKTLYFSSDGHGGLGNLDVFVSTRLADTCWDCWSKPVNLGKEINSSEEDWGYRIAPNGKDFYFAARENGAKQNDLFSITIPEKFRPEAVVNVMGQITDNQGNAVETQIVWEDLSSGDVIEKSKSNPVDGKYFSVLPNGKMYGYYVDDERYYPQSQNIDLTEGKTAQTVTKNITVTSYKEMKEQNTSVRLNNLFFDNDKSELLSYSIPELRRVAKIIAKNNLRVEIAGHTDSNGDDDYNMALSLRRAEAVKAFLVNEGCSASLFEVVGYGETKPAATNETVEGRAKNRRVEMRFL
ncbi:MAG: OmpA family protein [Bacteroidales bacterium]|nr:OmpA family protein [Bacteroidales bacterium]